MEDHNFGNPPLTVYHVTTARGDFAVKLSVYPQVAQRAADAFASLQTYYPTERYPHLLPAQTSVVYEHDVHRMAAIIQAWIPGKPLRNVTPSDLRRYPSIVQELDDFLNVVKTMLEQNKHIPDILTHNNIRVTPAEHVAFIATDTLLPHGAWGTKGRFMAGVIRTLINEAREGRPQSYDTVYKRLFEKEFLGKPPVDVLRRLTDARMQRK